MTYKTTDIGTILDLVCIHHTGLPLPSEFYGSNDWTYVFDPEGKKKAVYKIPASIFDNPFKSVNTGLSITLQIKRSMVIGELKDNFKLQEVSNINLEDFYYPYFVQKLSGGTWRNTNAMGTCPIPTDILDTHLAPLSDAIEEAINGLMERLSGAQYNQHGRDINRQIDLVLGSKHNKLEPMTYYTLIQILDVVITNSGNPFLIDYFGNWDNLTQLNPTNSKYTQIIRKKNKRLTTQRYHPTTYVLPTRDSQFYRHSIGWTTYYSHNSFASSLNQDCLTYNTTPKTKKATWTDWCWKVISMSRTSPLADNLGGNIRQQTQGRGEARGNIGAFWKEVKSHSHRIQLAPNRSTVKENLMRSILQTGGFGV